MKCAVTVKSITRLVEVGMADSIVSEINRIEAENARLKAEVERLRKAGDAMAKTANKEITRSEFGHLAMAWSAAKDGLGCPVNPDRVAQYLPKPPTAAKEGKPSV